MSNEQECEVSAFSHQAGTQDPRGEEDTFRVIPAGARLDVCTCQGVGMCPASWIDLLLTFHQQMVHMNPGIRSRENYLENLSHRK